MSRSIEKEVTIDAPVDLVWKALTEGEQLARWFPVEATVEPRLGGKVWLSWGGGMEGTAPIVAWEPHRRFGWAEDRGPVKIAVDFHLEAKGGTTVVRLVQSGFGAGPEWDDEYHMTDGGWSYFMQHLHWYIKRHYGVPRDLITLRESIAVPKLKGFARVMKALSTDGAMLAAKPGDRYRTTMANGDAITGQILSSSPATGQLGFTVSEFNDAVVFVETEPGQDRCRPAVWVSTYGLAERLEPVRQRLTDLYGQALGLNTAAAG